ncbi:sigma-70 family RNA polymerase sigma factor [Pseudoalteromonas denitrificans]|uniref:RNA polymerase sigma-70 factor, ECF subfamily n=1 Tax=Pseudoalteromonas denitrificans DSM 6059 TaxID=1123010 RepID=A0A1I1FCX9_9GAMM|nr:sigma-70 family RNA polymerase sigma factor [Pseudoalteromonas denitrificans]SFB97329.1 RNA polymerase sigma-70 factor, ECF subfamily [Pseudoalteromonas denitrificans DSM 6059]
MASDELLMLDYSKGDLKAFEVLYTKHKGPLYRYFMRQCTDKSKVDELFQEVWHKLIKAKENYQPQAKFTTWLYHIAHNVLIDEYRKFKIVGSDNNEINEMPAAINLESDLENTKLAQQLKLCIKSLPSAQLEAFVLKQEAGFDLQQISHIVNCDKESTKSRIRYAYSKLKICLNRFIGGYDE